MAGFLKDDKGNWSSMRLVLMFGVLLLCYQLYEFRLGYRKEIEKDIVDYTGLSLLFTTMIINFVFVLILKVIQKKFEN